MVFILLLLSATPPWDPGTAHSQQTSTQSLTTEQTLRRVSERVQTYYDGLFSIACTEELKQQRLKEDLTPDGKPDEFINDYLVLRQHGTKGDLVSATAWRTPRQVNTKAPDPKGHSRLPDPASLYTEPLSFLLPANLARYDFSAGGEIESHGRRVIVLTFSPREHTKPNVKWDGRHFTMLGIRKRGRLLIDSESYDVVELQTGLESPFEFRSPAVKRHGPFITFKSSPRLKLERSDTTIRLRAVVFHDPEQTLQLPESAETITKIRGAGVPLLRTSQYYSDYKRFLSQVTIRSTMP